MNSTHFLGETDSSSMVASSSPSRPKRSLLCFCRKYGGAPSYSEQCTLGGCKMGMVLIHTPFLITRLLEDDVNVSSNKLGYLLSLCGLDGVIALLVFSKILWVALKIAEIRKKLFYYLIFLVLLLLKIHIVCGVLAHLKTQFLHKHMCECDLKKKASQC